MKLKEILYYWLDIWLSWKIMTKIKIRWAKLFKKINSIMNSSLTMTVINKMCDIKKLKTYFKEIIVWFDAKVKIIKLLKAKGNSIIKIDCKIKLFHLLNSMQIDLKSTQEKVR